MKVTLAQLNPLVGDVEGNLSKLLKLLPLCEAEGSNLLVLSELFLVGYPPRDLLERSWFIERVQKAVQELIEQSKKYSRTAVLVGAPWPTDKNTGRGLYNAALLIAKGRFLFYQPKSLLPAYDVFDETRYFDSASQVTPFFFQGETLGISICEDAWSDSHRESPKSRGVEELGSRGNPPWLPNVQESRSPEIGRGNPTWLPSVQKSRSPKVQRRIEQHPFKSKRLYPIDPIEELARQGATLLVNLSASPFFIGKEEIRYRLLHQHAKKHHLPFVFVNQVGANDELVFDGKSLCLDESGECLARGAAFEEWVEMVELQGQPLGDRGQGIGSRGVGKSGSRQSAVGSQESRSPEVGRDNPMWLPSVLQTPNALKEYIPQEKIASLRDALVLGIRDYLRKCNFLKAVIGLSGGIDSAVVCVLAVQALGRENVLGVSMPSLYTSTESIEYARALAQNLGIDFRVIPITPVYHAYLEALKEVLPRVNVPLRSESRADDRQPTVDSSTAEVDVTRQNIQARIRGQILMALSNALGYLVLSTGNKSELAVGYCTLYGDMSGGLAVISDVPKTLVYELARTINQNGMLIPQEIIKRVPTAELKPNQKDQDTLPPYEVLDQILYEGVDEGRSLQEIIRRTSRRRLKVDVQPESEGRRRSASGGKDLDPRTVEEVIRAVQTNEYKRRQAAPGLKVTSKAFGMGWRMPIAARFPP